MMTSKAAVSLMLERLLLSPHDITQLAFLRQLVEKTSSTIWQNNRIDRIFTLTDFLVPLQY